MGLRGFWISGSSLLRICDGARGDGRLRVSLRSLFSRSMRSLSRPLVWRSRLQRSRCRHLYRLGRVGGARTVVAVSIHQILIQQVNLNAL